MQCSTTKKRTINKDYHFSGSLEVLGNFAIVGEKVQRKGKVGEFV